MINKPILHLNLIYKFYVIIEQEFKKEEYREIKPFYDKIFDKFGYVKIKG